MRKINEKQLINRVRFNYTQVLNEQFSMKSRFEFSFYSKQNREKGFLILQDIAYKPLEKPYTLNGRVAYFRTDGYNPRLYAYENDVLYSFSIPALYGNGIRSYLNIQYKLLTNLTLWLKAAATHQFATAEAGQPVAATTKSELKIQLRYQF
jgi:hypothetical protein